MTLRSHKDDLVHFMLPSHHMFANYGKAFLRAASEAFGIKTRVLEQMLNEEPTGVTVLCRADQFARFLVLRDAYGCINDFKGLRTSTVPATRHQEPFANLTVVENGLWYPPETKSKPKSRRDTMRKTVDAEQSASVNLFQALAQSLEKSQNAANEGKALLEAMKAEASKDYKKAQADAYQKALDEAPCMASALDPGPCGCYQCCTTENYDDGEKDEAGVVYITNVYL